jgi:homoserine dehydrogenase
MHYKLALLGFGNVGRHLARLLMRKQDELRQRYEITFSVVGIATGRHGAAIDPDGLDLEQALQAYESGHGLEPLSRLPVDDSLDFIHKCGADVLFENSPVNHATGEPAVTHAHTALELGMHVVTANKGTVVHAYRQLTNLAAARGLSFRFESTVMDGAPIFSLFRHNILAAQLKSIRGVLNSTSNLILGVMEQGGSFEEGVRRAQEMGVAETDPSADIDGWDAAIKVAALTTVLMGIPTKPQDVQREGIRAITPEMIAQARADGQRYKLVCSARRVGAAVETRVRPERVGIESPMYGVDGTTSIIQFETDVLGLLSVVETDPGPETTAYGLLADFVNIVT